jgi:hypothetical protein
MAAQIVWRVVDTAQALFDVDDYKQFVRVQVEARSAPSARAIPMTISSIRRSPCAATTTRSGSSFAPSLQARLAVAGITVDECGFTHLAYAQEIAGRCSAASRRRRSSRRARPWSKARSDGRDGARMLSEKNVVELDDERRAAMVSNLMVVLCGERDTQPVVNTGTLYQ